ncbi:MAG: hypothetical protein K8T25_00620, partial [Planctomycetia bacterium]|nr:hypothetical protein [Planctomycetia bacterium]
MTDKNKTQFAIVGLGHFAQTAILPAFANSGDRKLYGASSTTRQRTRRGGMPWRCLDRCLKLGLL